MVADVFALTGVVVTVNVAEEEPAATVTVLGTVADPLLLARLRPIPPAGAAPVRVAVPVDGEPPATLAGFNDSRFSLGALTVSAADFVTER
jgi:hypothetical protein